jgi:hypothetical protein
VVAREDTERYALLISNQYIQLKWQWFEMQLCIVLASEYFFL